MLERRLSNFLNSWMSINPPNGSWRNILFNLRVNIMPFLLSLFLKQTDIITVGFLVLQTLRLMLHILALRASWCVFSILLTSVLVQAIQEFLSWGIVLFFFFLLSNWLEENLFRLKKVSPDFLFSKWIFKLCHELLWGLSNKARKGWTSWDPRDRRECEEPWQEKTYFIHSG